MHTTKFSASAAVVPATCVTLPLGDVYGYVPGFRLDDDEDDEDDEDDDDDEDFDDEEEEGDEDAEEDGDPEEWSV
jgi:hypothetical protein